MVTIHSVGLGGADGTQGDGEGYGYGGNGRVIEGLGDSGMEVES